MKKKLLAFIFTLAIAMTIFVTFPIAAKAFDYSLYNSLCPITVYPFGDENFPTYTTVECTTKAGTIYSTDCCKILKFYKNSDGKMDCKVSYPVSGGTKTAYAKVVRFVNDTSFTPIKMTAAAKTNVSTKAGTSTVSGWYISSGDKFYVIGRDSSGNSQVVYPISGGYKMAWIKHYNVKFNANGGSGAPSTQIKTQNANLTLSSTKPKRTGYTFQSWNTAKDGSGTKYSPGGTYKANKAVTLYAQWKINTYKLTVNSNNTTMGDSGGGGTYNYGKSVTIKATPNTGYHFVKWNDGNTDNPKTITVTSNSTYTATFAINTYALTAKSSNTAMGSVTGSGTYNHGSKVTIKAVPAIGYHFVKWNDGNTDNPRIVDVTSAATYTATFAINTHTVTLSSADASMGRVSNGGTYDYGTKVRIIATPNIGYKFTKWGDGNTSATREITVTQNASYIAYFESDPNTCQHTFMLIY